MNAEKEHSQSADNSQLLAHKSSPQGGHAFKLKAPYKPTGDQPQAIAEAGAADSGREISFRRFSV